MSRDTLQTVTNTLPVLIPCAESDMDGIVETKDVKLQIVQVLTSDAIVSALKNPARNKAGPLGVPERVWKLMRNLKLLHIAHQRGDLTAAKAACEELVRMPELFPGVTDEERLSAERMSRIALNVAEDATSTDQRQIFYRMPNKEPVEVYRILGQNLCRMTNWILEGSRILLWLPGNFRGRFPKSGVQGKWVSGGAERLGVFCPTVEGGIAQLMFCDGIRICLRCHDLFLGKSHQDYCSVQCRETHRVARWRERKARGGKRHGRKN